uniref:Uncharacterized protein n=1 Tax=Arion vulgaris TaxID=1028688 RepID=A0A0B7AFI8_9EUPU
MEGLIESLNRNKWQTVQVADKTGDFQEYHVSPHAHKKVGDSSFCYMIENDTVDPKKVVLEYALNDPIKNVALLEIRLNDDGTKITGLDLDGDVVLLKQ